MDFNRTGRAVGIGVRVLGRMAGKRLGDVSNSTRPTLASSPNPGQRAAAAAKQAARARDGGRRFGRSFWGPLRRAGHSLTLEIAGAFFALFGAWFLQNAWRLRAFLRSGEEHTRFLVYMGLGVAFLYFSVSSFLRARKAARKA